jgi:hypothetical protein
MGQCIVVVWLNDEKESGYGPGGWHSLHPFIQFELEEESHSVVFIA